MLRKAVVAGQFYPASPKRLDALIEDLEPKAGTKIDAAGIILPHAGYKYSGRVAVSVVSRILPKKRIIILGPNHSQEGPDFGLWPRGAWETPYADIEIDQTLAGLILKEGSMIKEDYSSHIYEHSIEVELPIIYKYFKEFSIVPISCKSSSLKNYKAAALQLFKALKGKPKEILIVASTDFSHYEPEQAARKKDRSAIASIVAMEEEALLRNIRDFNISMCGPAPVAVFIILLKKMGFVKSQVVLYQTSAETTGDYKAVVGYAGIIVN